MRLRLRSVVPEVVPEREAIRRERLWDRLWAIGALLWVANIFLPPSGLSGDILGGALGVLIIASAIRSAYWHGWHQSTAARNRWERRGYLE